jgi:hypothetical protein
MHASRIPSYKRLRRVIRLAIRIALSPEYRLIVLTDASPLREPTQRYPFISGTEGYGRARRQEGSYMILILV